MKQELLSKFSLITLLALFLFSCGTSSNGIFEKRKHLKGWYYKKKANRAINSLHEKSKAKIHKNKFNHKSNLSLRQGRDDAHKKTSKIGIVRKEEYNVPEKQRQNILIDTVQSKLKLSAANTMVDHNNDNLVFNSGENNISFFKNRNAMHKVFSSNIHQNADFKINVRAEGEPLVEDNPKINSPMGIALKFIGFFYLFSLALFLVSILSLLILYVTFPIIGLLFLIGGTYLCLVYFFYLVSRLLRREDGKEIWTLKQSFLRVGKFYSVFVVVLTFTVLALLW